MPIKVYKVLIDVSESSSPPLLSRISSHLAPLDFLLSVFELLVLANMNESQDERQNGS